MYDGSELEKKIPPDYVKKKPVMKDDRWFEIRNLIRFLNLVAYFLPFS